MSKDQSASRYSSGKFDAAKYYAEFRSGMFGDGWKSDATTSHEHVEALEATVSAALNVAGEILASRSEQQQRQKEPPPGLLVSIALRLDHALFMPNILTGETEEQHQRRIEVALQDARRAWEECSGRGFYSPEREAEYANHLGLDKRSATEDGGKNG